MAFHRWKHHRVWNNDPEAHRVGTEITVVMNYELPYSILGKIVDKLMVSKGTERGFERG